MNYYSLSPRSFISEDFFNKYGDAPFGELGFIVALRTYCRWVPELKRRETWREVCLRVVEDSFKDSGTIQEAEAYFDHIFNLRCFPAGRTLWVAGTEVNRKYHSANFNCSFASIDSFSKMAEGFGWLMLGAGFGFSVEDKYIKKLPPVFPHKKVIHQYPTESYSESVLFAGEHLERELLDLSPEERKKQLDAFYKKYEKKKWDAVEQEESISLYPFTKRDRVESTYIYTNQQCYTFTRDSLFQEKYLPPVGKHVKIVVGDDRWAWVNAFRILLELHTLRHVELIHIDYCEIRPKGERIKTFGGRASGYDALYHHFKRVVDIINEETNVFSSICGLRLSDLQCLDILNSMGLAVVVAGVRRSAEIALFDVGSTVAKAKSQINEKTLIRAMSNNSAMIYNSLTREQVKELIDPIRYNGEPGFYFMGNARTKITKLFFEQQHLSYKDAESLANEYCGTNPCGEIILYDRGLCNLVDIVLSKFVNGTEFDYAGFQNALKLSVEHSIRMTLGEQWHPEWTKNQWKHRLLGISLTGIEDAFDALNWTLQQKEAFLTHHRGLARSYADEYSQKLGINAPLLVTCIKPSGTLAKLPTVSSGCHKSYSPYYLCRIRLSAKDPLAQVLQALGYPVTPQENYEEWLKGEFDIHDAPTWIVAVPVKTNAKIRSIDEPAIDQLERYKLLATCWADHNPSVTISVASDEWEKVSEWVYQNQQHCIGITFFPKFDPKNSDLSYYSQLPLEDITEEEYYALKEKYPKYSQEDILSLLNQLEQTYEEYDLETDCQGGCPVR